MFDNPVNLVGTIVIITALGLGSLSFIRPQLFQRKDIILIVVFLVCGIVLVSQQKLYRQEFTQFNLIMLAVTAIFYTIENIRLRIKNTQ
jgi:Ca2+/Na+ antiporter